MNYMRIVDIKKFDDVTCTFNDPKTMLYEDHEYYYEKPVFYTPIIKNQTRLNFAIIDWTNRNRYNGTASKLTISKFIDIGILRNPTDDENAKLMLMDMGLRE